MERAYAQALWIKIKAGEKPSHAIQALYRVLTTQGRTALIPKISRAFERIALRDNAQHAMTLTIADSAHERTAKAHMASMMDSAPSVTTVVDSSVIGGWRLEGDGLLLDNTHKKHLTELYRRIV